MTKSDTPKSNGDEGRSSRMIHPRPPGGLTPCAMRHLAYAAGDLAGDSGLDLAIRERYREAEAAFRSLADAEWSDDGHLAPQTVTPPTVQTGLGTAIPLAELLIRAWERHGRPFPRRGIDADMVDAARQLLQELRWQVAGYAG